jgi:hypothetical protein
MRIVFFMRHVGYVRNFESTLGLLCERGHDVHVALGTKKATWLAGRKSGLDQLSERHPNLSYGLAPAIDDHRWFRLARRLRAATDYLRYLDPRYRRAPRLRARAERKARPLIPKLARLPLVRSAAGIALLRRLLTYIEACLPPSPAVDAFIRDCRPDIVLVTPLLDLRSPQGDYVRSAKRARIRTGLCVASWDNLTNKGMLRDIPEIVTVWNEAQRREAVELHGVPPSQVVVTGAQSYDHWFDWAPSTTRDEFCRRIGLPPDCPFLLYLCSSPFIGPQEASFVQVWVRRLRAQDDHRLREIGVLVRPHPQNAAQWEDVDLSGEGSVVVWPRAGADPVDSESKADYYDSIYHSAAVVGVNTSALIESAIVGRSVYTLLASELRDSQEGTLHFEHLLSEGGGLLKAATSFEQHAAQLAEAAEQNGRDDQANLRFLEAFVRPAGIAEPATPRLVEAIETAARGPLPAEYPPPRGAPLVRLALRPLARSRAQRIEEGAPDGRAERA